MTKAQEIYEKVEALVAEGIKKAGNAFRQDHRGVRTAVQLHARRLPTPTPAPSTPTPPRAPAGHGAGARACRRTPDRLGDRRAQQAIEMIDHELDTAREKAERAQVDHEQLLASAEERKQTLQAKIASSPS